jgi:hypothetical protein
MAAWQSGTANYRNPWTLPAQAGYKFFFLADQTAFRLMAGKYAAQIPNVTIVLLTTGEEHTVSSS